MANSWPETIPVPDTITEVIQKPIESSKSINSFTSRSTENTISVRVYSIGWGMLTVAEKGYLMTFFNSNMGGNFSWTHPVSGITYTTIFDNDKLSFRYVGKDIEDISYYSCNLSLVTHDIILPNLTNISAPVISGDIFEGATLSVTSDGEWANIPSSYTYQWYRDSNAITGATNSSYVLTSSDITSLLACSVIAANSIGVSTEVMSNQVSTVPTE